MIEMQETKQNTETKTQQLSEFHDIIIHHGQNLTFRDFLHYQGFNENKFGLPLQFWFHFNTKRDDEWIVLTDEIINLIAFKSSMSNTSHNCLELLAFIKNYFIQGIDFFTTARTLSTHGTSGVCYKIEIQMKKRPFKKMLLKIGTETCDHMHDYILDIESGAMKYALYKNQCELYKKNEENTRLRALTNVPILETYRKNALTMNKQKKNVYVFTCK